MLFLDFPAMRRLTNESHEDYVLRAAVSAVVDQRHVAGKTRTLARLMSSGWSHEALPNVSDVADAWAAALEFMALARRRLAERHAKTAVALAAIERALWGSLDRFERSLGGGGFEEASGALDRIADHLDALGDLAGRVALVLRMPHAA